MPLPAALLPILAAAIPAIIGGIQVGISARNSKKNRQAQERQNEQDRQHEWQMWQQQMQEERSRWNDANAYNHPDQQMQRLREAGLNPNLVYGKGADNTANVLAPKQATPSSKPAPQIAFDSSGLNRIGNSITEYAQVRALSAQTDNTYMALAKQAAETAKTEFELEQAKDLKSTVIAQASANLEKTQAETGKTNVETERIKVETDLAIQKMGVELERLGIDKEKLKNDTNRLKIEFDRNEREQLANSANIELTYEKVLTERLNRYRTEIQNTTDKLKQQELQIQIQQAEELLKHMKYDTHIKAFEATLAHANVSKSDPLYWRLFSGLLTYFGITEGN